MSLTLADWQESVKQIKAYNVVCCTIFNVRMCGWHYSSARGFRHVFLTSTGFYTLRIKKQSHVIGYHLVLQDALHKIKIGGWLLQYATYYVHTFNTISLMRQTVMQPQGGGTVRFPWHGVFSHSLACLCCIICTPTSNLAHLCDSIVALYNSIIISFKE